MIVGWFLGVIIAISIGYAALILGFSIEGSELAAILGFGILRGMLGRYSIIENNIAQTVASAVNSASSGMMFSIPAIFILGYGDRFDPYLMTFGCIAGAFLGIAFIIPLRKHMIDYERLTYPGGVAVATILKSPGAGMKKAILLLGAAAAAGLMHAILQIIDLMAFADARNSMKHLYSLQDFADVMSAFAAGERYINRVWSASADGYVDEVTAYLERAHAQFIEAQKTLDAVHRKHAGPASTEEELAT